MPELPEVETIRRALVADLVGRSITAATAHPSAKFSSATEAAGSTVCGLHRRGKYLIIGLDGRRELVVHLGMTGQLGIERAQHPPAAGSATDPARSRYVRARWSFDDHTALVFNDVRRFGRLAVVDRGHYSSLPTLANLGPEPLSPSFTAEAFWRSLKASRIRLKTQLLSQRPVAGVGNIYADEALWRAELHPGLRRVTRAQAGALHETIRQVLRQGVMFGGTTLRDYRTPDGGEGANQHELDCYGRSGEPCGRCGESLRRVVIDARSTTYCPVCQAR